MYSISQSPVPSPQSPVSSPQSQKQLAHRLFSYINAVLRCRIALHERLCINIENISVFVLVNPTKITNIDRFIKCLPKQENFDL